MKNDLSPELSDRLQKISPRAARPLTHLYNIGSLDDSILTTVLDAADLSNEETWQLPAFAISYLYHRSNGVPVADTINMAKQHGRRIHLWWSAARWKTEHDKLSRLAALKSLEAKNVTYDLDDFRQHLPEHFSGYLIPSSRRLGMEGLRQRHCIASYHSQINNGSTAIVVMFVNRQRWTVELLKTSNVDNPLRIGQIKTRLNATASLEIRQSIHDQLAIKDTLSFTSSSSRPKVNLWRQNLSRIIERLFELGCEERITIDFSGYGDSGSVDQVFLSDEYREASVTFDRGHSDYEDGVWTRRTTAVQDTLAEALKEFAYEYLDETEVDWYNNDGGFGELVIDLKQRNFTAEVNVNISNSETEHSVDMMFDEFIDTDEPATAAVGF